MCIYIYVYIYVCIHTYIHTYVYTYICIYISSHLGLLIDFAPSLLRPSERSAVGSEAAGIPATLQSRCWQPLGRNEDATPESWKDPKGAIRATMNVARYAKILGNMARS